MDSIEKIFKTFLLAFYRGFEFKSRSSRTEYWTFVLFNIVFCLLIGVLMAVTANPVIGILFLIYALSTGVIGLSITVRRMHDANFSAWWLLASFIPIAGPIFLLVLMFLASKDDGNRFGENPSSKIEEFASKPAGEFVPTVLKNMFLSALATVVVYAVVIGGLFMVVGGGIMGGNMMMQ